MKYDEKSKRIVHKNFIKSDSSEILVEKCRTVIYCVIAEVAV